MAKDAAGNLVPDSQGGGWTVENQQETIDTGPDGRPTAGVRVSFVTYQGLHASVFVPRSLYNPPNVQAMISEYVQRLHAVNALSTPPPTG